MKHALTLLSMLILSVSPALLAQTTDQNPSILSKPGLPSEKAKLGAKAAEAPPVALEPAVPDPQLSKVYSCSLDFPLDSVQFDEALVQECFHSIDPKRIAYVHIIATATTTGSNDHNLYLSNRRAGAIEGFIRNRYPEVPIHAFGAGKNPKFGKSARIFLVESAKADPVGLVEVIEKTPPPAPPKVQIEYRYKTKTEIKYLPKDKVGVDASLLAGVANFRPNPSPYQFFGVHAAYQQTLPYLREVGLGLRYTISRSNEVLDIHSTAFTLNKFYKLPKMFAGLAGEGVFDAGVQGLVGMTYIDAAEYDAGLSGILRYRLDDYTSALNVGYSRHFQWVGLEMGVLL